MDLLIVRHAIAFPRNAKRWPDDGERPLTAAGIRRARRAAAGLKRMVKRPDVVLTSPLVRARDTARIFSQAAHWPEAAECEALAPQGGLDEVLEAVRRHGAKVECVALVGHQPHLGRLLAHCLRGNTRAEAFELKKSAVACLQFEAAPGAGRALLTALLPPRALRRL